MKPSVLCIGFARCGTTTLYNILEQHKDIFLPGIKEPAYYSRKNLYKKGFNWYLKRYYPKSTNKKVVMEVNPLIAKSAEASRILEDFGEDTKIIILVRNPIQRLYSNFKMNLAIGGCFKEIKDNISSSTSKLFSKWLKTYYNEDEKMFKKCSKTNFVVSGEYYKVIKDYIDVFGKDKVKVIIFEDFIKEPQIYCQEIYDFIGLEDDPSINYNVHSNEGDRIPISKLSIKINRFYFKNICNRILLAKLPYISRTFCKIINRINWIVPKRVLTKKDTRKEKMLDKDKEILRNYYYEDIKKLGKLLDVDLLKRWKM